MIRTFLILIVALFVGCDFHQGHTANSQHRETEQQSLKQPPNEILESVVKLYDTESQGWSKYASALNPADHPVFGYALNDLISRGELSEQNAGIAREALLRNIPRKLDSARVLELLEISGYADVMCEPREYELRISTMQYLQSQIDSPLVRNTLTEIAAGYKCELPDDDQGLLVTAMQVRVPEYAERLMQASKRNNGG